YYHPPKNTWVKSTSVEIATITFGCSNNSSLSIYFTGIDLAMRSIIILINCTTKHCFNLIRTKDCYCSGSFGERKNKVHLQFCLNIMNAMEKFDQGRNGDETRFW
ncbi:Hypothetical predicted protein, partial [Mytilus galloprovincialis]